MVANTQRATIDDLSRAEGKAELVDGRIVLMSPTGYRPSHAAGEVYVSLRDYVRRTKRGLAVTDNTAFVVELPHRQSFSPDAAYHLGKPTGMKFLEGAPVFAVEVRSEGDYGRSAEEAMRQKRADYFAAGTLVVWDVDVRDEPVVRKYSAATPGEPVTFTADEAADAEPAVPGWSMAVRDLVPGE